MDFPCVITKGEFRYQVDSQAALDYHLGQGWVLESAVDYTGLTADQVEAWGRSMSAQMDDLSNTLAASTSSLSKRISALENAPFPVDIEALVMGILDRDVPTAVETALKTAMSRDVPSAPVEEPVNAKS
jgi:hypothetical protein